MQPEDALSKHSSLLSCAVASSHCAALARSDAPVTEAKARNEYGMEQEVNSQIPRSMQNQNQNQNLAVYLVGVLAASKHQAPQETI